MNAIYLNLPVAVQRIGDAELVDEMLVMLQASLPQDWRDFLSLMAEKKYTEAEKIVHQLKGTIPFFSDEVTAQLLHHLDALLKTGTDQTQILQQFELMRIRMDGFQAELDDWFEKTHS